MKSRSSLAWIGAVFMAGMLLSLWGLKSMHWREARAFSDGGLALYIPFLIVCALVIFEVAKRIRRSPLVAAVFLAITLAFISGSIWPLLAVIWFGLASAVFGRAVLSVLGIANEKNEWSLSFLTGAGIYGTAAGLLAHFPVNYPALYGIALAAPLIFARHTLRELSISICSWMSASRPEASVSRLDATIGIVALVYFCVSMMPEIGFDALAMHLFVPVHLNWRHQWSFDADNYVWAVMPMLGDWIFSIGYMLAGETAARMINVGFVLVLSWQVYKLATWAGASPRGGKWAALIFLSTPLAFMEGSSLFIESVWASFVVGGSFEVLKTCFPERGEKADLRGAALLLGCAMAAKAVTLPLLPVLLPLLAFFPLRASLKARNYSTLGTAILLFFIVGGIPYFTAYWLTGNPVFPFFNGIFRSRYYPAVNFDVTPVFGTGLHWDTLYQITFNSGKFLESRAGAAGFQWLLLFLPAAAGFIASRHRKGLVLLFIGILYVAATFHSTAYLRYVFPSFALLTAAIGIAFSAWETDHFLLRKGSAIAGSVVVFLNLLFLSAGAAYRDFPLASLRDGSAREGYLRQNAPIRSAVAAVNALNISQTPVAVFSEPLAAGLRANALYPDWYNFRFQSEINSATTEMAMANVLSNRGVDFVMLDANWGKPGKRALIEKTTEEIAEIGPISIRTLSRAYRFQRELLKNPDFSKRDDWLFPAGEAGKAPDGILVTVDKPAYQAIQIAPGRRYLNTVKTRCEKQASQGRMQVNWLDSKSRFISTDISVFDCSDAPAEHSMEITAPMAAASAVVYASGHTSTPLVFEEISLR